MNKDITSEDNYTSLASLSHEQLVICCLRYRKYIDSLEQWKLDAFEISPNIDLDIERLRAIRMRENRENA